MQHDITRWLDEALAQVPVELNADSNGTTHRQIADSYLRPLLKRCRATKKAGFWQWLRFQLAKTEETACYLVWMRESRCPLEVKTSSKPDGGLQYVVTATLHSSKSPMMQTMRCGVSRRHILNGRYHCIRSVSGDCLFSNPMKHVKFGS